MKCSRVIWIVILIFFSAGCTSKIAPEEEAIAIRSADEWLTLVDSEQYAASWDEAAEFLKDAVAKEKWLETMETVRKPMGALVSRKVKSTQFRTMMPHALKGKYLIIDYESSFSNKKSVVESITQMMGKDGKWRVGGYHLDRATGM